MLARFRSIAVNSSLNILMQLASVLQELVRDGNHSVADLMALGKHILGRRHVQPSVPDLLHEVMIEGTFKDGTFLVTV